MKFFKEHKLKILIGILIVTAFFTSRLYRIESLPLFTDEAIYVRWSQIARYDAAWRFISLTDGKQPSFVWAAMNIMRFVNDPLMAARLVSVIAGFFSLIGIFLLGREIFRNTWVGIISSFLYLVFPMSLVYDRMALYDSLVGSFTIWALYLEILLVRKLRLDIAMIAGMVAGGAALTKTSGFFSIYLLPFTLLLFNWNSKNKYILLLKWIGLSIVVLFFTYGMYSLLRLSPFFHIISDKNSIFVYPLKEWLEHPLRFWLGNIRGLWDWFITYITIPMFLLIIASFVVSFKFFKEKLLLVIWFITPFVALAVFGKVLYPRFIFFMTLSLLPLIAFSIFEISKRLNKAYLIGIFVFLFSFLMIKADYYIVTDIAVAPIPKSDLEQYINGWPAGGGLSKIIPYLQEKAKDGKIYVTSEGTFGSLPTYAVEIYLGDNKNVEKRGIWPLPPQIPEDLTDRAKKMPVYFIFNESQTPPPGWPIKLIAKYQKGVGNQYMSLYQVEAKSKR